jgi:RHS repeat-associated protein
VGVVDAVANRYRSEYTYDANGNIETLERYDADGTGHYDSFAYHYHTNGGRKQQNRLYELIDDAPMSTGSDIVTTATGFDNSSNGVNVNNNYGYDALGNLIRDTREGITNIDWTVAGKVRSVVKTTGPSLAFAYGASGQRTMKQVSDPDLDEAGHREHYVRDAQGNIMATYRYTNTAAASLKLHERPLYGSSRLGSLRTEVELRSLPSFDPTSANPVQQVDLNYELTDHLGNVCAVVTGRLLDGNGGGTPKQAELVSAQGYEPGGSLLPGRNYSSSTYAFGFNGMRKDDEIHGATGTSYDFGARLYDPRVGRWWSIDPYAGKYAPVSPYVFALNNSVIFVDEDGNEVIGADGKPVTYTRSESGAIEWSQNATADVRKIGNAMLSTPTGTEQFEKMRTSRNKIMLIADNTTSAHDLRTPTGLRLAGTQHPWIDADPLNPTNNITMDKYGVTTVTIYENTIDEAVGRGSVDGVKGIGFMEAIGAVASHEAEHAASPENIKLQQWNLMLKKNFSDPALRIDDHIEKVPEAIGRRAGQEAVDMRPKRMEPRSILPSPESNQNKQPIGQ